MSEGILAASQCRTTVAEIYQTGSSAAAPLPDGWGCGEASATPPTKFVQVINTSVDGVITVTMANLPADLKTAAGTTLTLTPQTAATPPVNMTVAAHMGQQVGAFRCQPGSIPPKYLPGSCK